MPLLQAPVSPLPEGIDLSGKTVIVTGATAGIGLEISRQLLLRKVTNLIMAVRSTSKGETVKKTLRSDPAVKSANAYIKVMELDMDSYESVKRFVSSYKAEFQDLHLLMANAGIETVVKEFASSGHEKSTQVNYLSNVLLTLGLLPILEATASRTGEPTRVTWTGSRTYRQTSLAETLSLKNGEKLLEHFDTAMGIPEITRYFSSKLLCFLFQREVAQHYTPEKVIINSFCPGLVDTGITDVLSLYMRIPMSVVKAIRARSPEKAGWIALNAGVVVGAETHGKLLEDTAADESWPWVDSDESRRVQRMLWNETIDEMAGLVDVPVWMSKLA